MCGLQRPFVAGHVGPLNIPLTEERDRQERNPGEDRCSRLAVGVCKTRAMTQIGNHAKDNNWTGSLIRVSCFQGQTGERCRKTAAYCDVSRTLAVRIALGFNVDHKDEGSPAHRSAVPVLTNIETPLLGNCTQPKFGNSSNAENLTLWTATSLSPHRRCLKGMLSHIVSRRPKKH